MQVRLRYDPWIDLAGRSDIVLEHSNLDGVLGYSEPGRVCLDTGQRRMQARCTLAHELAHLDRGDLEVPVEDTPDGPRLARRHERGADRLAARRLVELDALADALRWARDEFELANELDVDPETLRVRLGGLTPGERRCIGRRLGQLHPQT
jgi:hypothetical protein